MPGTISTKRTVLCLFLFLAGCKTVGGLDQDGLSNDQRLAERIPISVDARVVEGSRLSFDADLRLGYNLSWDKKSGKTFYLECSFAARGKDLLAAAKDEAMQTLKGTFKTVATDDGKNLGAALSRDVASKLDISVNNFQHRLRCGERIDDEHHCEYRVSVEFGGVFSQPSAESRTLWAERVFTHKHPAPLSGPTSCDRYFELASNGVRSTTKEAIEFFGKMIRSDLNRQTPVQSSTTPRPAGGVSGSEAPVQAETVFMSPAEPWAPPDLAAVRKVPGRYLVQVVDARAFVNGLPRVFSVSHMPTKSSKTDVSCAVSLEADKFGKSAEAFSRSHYESMFDEVVFAYARNRELKRGVDGFDGISRLEFMRWQPDVTCDVSAGGRTCLDTGHLSVKHSYRLPNGSIESMVTQVDLRKFDVDMQSASCGNIAAALADKIADGVRATIRESVRHFADEIRRTGAVRSN